MSHIKYSDLVDIQKLQALLERMAFRISKSFMSMSQLPFRAPLFSSLQLRVTLMTVSVFVAGLWVAALLLVRHQEENLHDMLAAQQVTTARYVAREIDSKIRMRLESLESIAARIPSPIDEIPKLESYLQERRAIYKMFDFGLIVVKPDLSAAYADFPVLPGRRTSNRQLAPFADVARTGRPSVGEPHIGRYSESPMVPMAVPIKDDQGRMRGILAGITSIDAPFFLEPLSQYRQAQGGSIEIVAPRSGLMLAGSDRRNIMKPMPAAGTVPLDDRLVAQEGSLVGLNAQGVEELASSYRISSSDWFVIVRLPTTEAFAPVRTLQAQVLAIAAALSLIVGLLTALLVRYALHPVKLLAIDMNSMSRGVKSLHALPVLRQDEVGNLVDSFNRFQASLLSEQAAQREGEERLRTLIEAIPDAVQFKDRDGRWLVFNRTAQCSFGLEHVDCQGKSDVELAQLAPPSFRDPLLQCRATDELVWQAGTLSRVEEVITLPDASILTFDVTKVPLFESDGARKGLVIIGRDITAARRAETELQQLGEAVRQCSEAIILVDETLHFQYINPAFERLLGYTLDEVRGRSLSLLVPDDPALRETNAIILGGPFTGERLRRAKDGRVVPVLLNIAPIRLADGRRIGLVGTMTDLTHIKQVEARLESERTHLRTLVQTIPDMVWLKDPNGIYLACNPEFERFFGAPEAEIIGKTDYDFVAAELADFFRKKDREAMAAGRPSVNEEWITYASNGHRALLETIKTPMSDGTGRMMGVLGIARNITERKQAEAELKRSNAELEQFSYGISHDMRQPLRMIASYLQLLDKELADQLDDEKRKFLNFAKDGAKRLDQMLVGLLEYSRVGRKGEPPVWIESRAVLDEALLFLRPAVAEAQAIVRVEGDWPRILASPDEMLRLMQNLLGNALKYRVPGRTPEVAVTGEIVGKEWCMCVADNGIGIIPDQIGRLFQVFQRLQSRAVYEGTGIGLALCRKIAEHHGGRIWAESAGEGQGSRFCVALPQGAF
ncbi:MAG: PAS domain S-box protein [Sterolibacterium sp.]|nr:PAS domain S-box protein [Sterolibacterium sp.]